jgi:hypothetical protein
MARTAFITKWCPLRKKRIARVARQIIAKKKAEKKDYIGEVKALLSMYVPADPQRMEQAYQAGKFALNLIMSLLGGTYGSREREINSNDAKRGDDCLQADKPEFRGGHHGESVFSGLCVMEDAGSQLPASGTR